MLLPWPAASCTASSAYYVRPAYCSGDDQALPSSVLPGGQGARKEPPLPSCVNRPQAYLDYLSSNSKIVREVRKYVTTGKEDTVSGYLAVDDSAERIILSFRGTVGSEQMLIEVCTRDTSVYWDDLPDVRVNSYFGDAAKVLLASRSFSRALKTLVGEKPNYDIYVTGHSLGGAIAGLFAASLIRSNVLPRDKTYVYTFGQPRIGDINFAPYYKRLVRTSFRVVLNEDPIPHFAPCPDNPVCPMIPGTGPCPCGKFQSTGAITSNYGYHGDTEIWYPEGEYRNGVMCDYRECVGDDGLGEDYSCSDKVVPVTAFFRDHLGYFNILKPNNGAYDGQCRMAPRSGHPDQPGTCGGGGAGSSSTRSPSRADSSTRSPSRADGSTRSPSRADGRTRSPSRADSSIRPPKRADTRAPDWYVISDISE